MKTLSHAAQITRKHKEILWCSNRILEAKRKISQLKDDVALYEKNMLNAQLALEKLRSEQK